MKKEIVNYIRVPATLPKKTKYIYDKNNRVVRKNATGYKYVAHVMTYDENGNHTHTYRIDRTGSKIPYLEKEYNAKNQLVKAINYGPYLLLCNGEKEKNDAKDVLIVNYSYHDNGLVATEEVLKNEILIYFWEYDYLFFDDKN